MVFIPVLVVALILWVFLKWLNGYEKPKNPKKTKRQTDLKNALEDFKSQLDIRK